MNWVVRWCGWGKAKGVRVVGYSKGRAGLHGLYSECGVARPGHKLRYHLVHAGCYCLWHFLTAACFPFLPRACLLVQLALCWMP